MKMSELQPKHILGATYIILALVIIVIIIVKNYSLWTS